LCWLRAAFAVALDALHRELERGLPVRKRVAIDLVDVALDVLGVVPHVQEDLALRSEPELLIHQDRRDTAGSDRLVDNQEVIYSAGNAVGLPGPQVLKRKAVLVDASQPGVEIGNDLLTTDNEDDVTRSGDDWTELAAAGRRD